MCVNTTGSRAVVAMLIIAACAALVLPPYYGYRYRGNFWMAMFGSSDAMTSISLDAIIAGVAFLVWALLDMQQLQFSLLSYLALVASFAVALALPIPLYLASRTVRQCNMVRRAAQVRADAVRCASTACCMSPVCLE